MTAKEIAYALTRLLDERPYSFAGVTLYLGGKYPCVEAFDLNRDVEFIVLCSDVRYSEQAQRFLDARIQQIKKERGRDIEGHIAQPHSTDASAWVLCEWIWDDDGAG